MSTTTTTAIPSAAPPPPGEDKQPEPLKPLPGQPAGLEVSHVISTDGSVTFTAKPVDADGKELAGLPKGSSPVNCTPSDANTLKIASASADGMTVTAKPLRAATDATVTFSANLPQDAQGIAHAVSGRSKPLNVAANPTGGFAVVDPQAAPAAEAQPSWKKKWKQT